MRKNIREQAMQEAWDQVTETDYSTWKKMTDVYVEPTAKKNINVIFVYDGKAFPVHIYRMEGLGMRSKASGIGEEAKNYHSSIEYVLKNIKEYEAKVRDGY